MSRKALLAVGVGALLVGATVGALALAPNQLGATPANGDEAAPTNNDAAAQAQSTAASGIITVSATGSASAAPDEALVYVAVRADGNDSATVRSTLADRASELRAALDELNVTYETSRYSIRNVERERRDDRPDAPAFEGEHAFAVTVDDPDRVGAVVTAAANATATVDAVELTLSAERRAELRDRAIERAMADADRQASTVAATANLSLAGVTTVDATQSDFQPVAFETAASRGDSAAPDTVIDAGEVSVTYRVTVTYNATG